MSIFDTIKQGIEEGWDFVKENLKVKINNLLREEMYVLIIENPQIALAEWLVDAAFMMKDLGLGDMSTWKVYKLIKLFEKSQGVFEQNIVLKNGNSIPAKELMEKLKANSIKISAGEKKMVLSKAIWDRMKLSGFLDRTLSALGEENPLVDMLIFNASFSKMAYCNTSFDETWKIIDEGVVKAVSGNFDYPVAYFFKRNESHISNRLLVGEFLSPNEKLISQNKRYYLKYSPNGILELCRASDDQQYWSRGTITKNAWRVYFQDDGNIVIYSEVNQVNRPEWSSDSFGFKDIYKTYPIKEGTLILLNSGNIAAYASGKNYWNSGTIAEIPGAIGGPDKYK